MRVRPAWVTVRRVQGLSAGLERGSSARETEAGAHDGLERSRPRGRVKRAGVVLVVVPAVFFYFEWRSKEIKIA